MPTAWRSSAPLSAAECGTLRFGGAKLASPMRRDWREWALIGVATLAALAQLTLLIARVADKVRG